jgi:hypothetical protein
LSLAPFLSFRLNRRRLLLALLRAPLYCHVVLHSPGSNALRPTAACSTIRYALRWRERLLRSLDVDQPAGEVLPVQPRLLPGTMAV